MTGPVGDFARHHWLSRAPACKGAGTERRGFRLIAALSLTASVFWVASLHAGASAGSEGMLGVLTPLHEVELEPPIEGRLVTVAVRIGDLVTQGALIAALDDRPIRRELAEAEARLEAARAGEAEARTRLRMAEDLFERQRALIEKQAVSREAVRAAQQGVELATAELNQALAEVRHHEASAAHQRERLNQTRLQAPFSGTIAERYANPGMTVGPGRPVARLISNETLRARFAAPVERAGELAPERQIRLIVTSIGQQLDGIITQVGSEVDPASGMIICEATVNRPSDWNGPPLSGQAVRVWIEADSQR